VNVSLKGRGLYKQGKIEESLSYLRKAEEKWIGLHKVLHRDVQEAEQALANKNNTK
jgi:hypothetical protein